MEHERREWALVLMFAVGGKEVIRAAVKYKVLIITKHVWDLFIFSIYSSVYQ